MKLVVSNIIFEVYAERIHPNIKLWFGDWCAKFGDNWFNQTIIVIDLKSIFEEYSQNVRDHVSALLFYILFFLFHFNLIFRFFGLLCNSLIIVTFLFLFQVIDEN